MARVVVVGLGPAGPDLVTEKARQVLTESGEVWLRTKHHPAASIVPNASSFDDVYDTADRFEDVYQTIVNRLVDMATTRGEVVYAVPGSPWVAERTVELLVQTDVDVEAIAGMSFLELVWPLVGDPLHTAPRIVDGHRFAMEAAGQLGPLLVAQCDTKTTLTNIKLAYEDDAPEQVVVLQRLGAPDQSVQEIAWDDLDRIVEPDYLTTLWIPYVGAPIAQGFERLHEVARDLRERCPWDREQTHQSLKRHAVEETYELLDAIDDTDLENDDDGAYDEHLIEELGDVLFQVFAHSAIAEQEGRFNVHDVVTAVTDKLIERHPHVYGDVVANTADEVLSTWESNKMKAKSRSSVLDGIPRDLPALMLADKVLKRASDIGIEFDPDRSQVKGVGAALMLLVAESRQRGVDAEGALRSALGVFMEQIQAAEA
jgi:tetrapyrrole methylase family protein / MazG family protein